jgi:MoaA/NifB/PqqE/SkfB family radical SAM enzyme
MNKSRTKTRFYSGARALPFRLAFLFSLTKYVIRRKKYPLFTLRATQGGYAKSRRALRALKLGKYLKFNGHYRFALSMPRWPSRPFDHMVGLGGLNIMAAGTPFKQQIDTAILGITRKCLYACRHCYEKFNLAEEETVPLERWKSVIQELQNVGVGIIVISGGEPTLRHEDVLDLLETADKERSEFHLHTSGHGVTAGSARALRKAGLAAAAVGLDDVVPERHDALRGCPGAHQKALQAIRLFQEAGVFTYVNMCLSKDLVRQGGLWPYMELLKELNVGAVRFLEPKPCGGYQLEKREDLFSDEDRKIVTDLFIQANLGKKYRHFPLISYEGYFEDPKRLGCMMAGHSHLYIDSLGNVEPCVFLPISFGNIMDKDFREIFRKMRNIIPHPFHGPCPSLLLAEKIKEKKNQGVNLPIPHYELEKEWRQMYERA